MIKRSLFGILAIIIDGLLVNLGVIIGFLVRFGGNIPPENFEAYRIMIPFITGIMIMTAYIFGLYNFRKDTLFTDIEVEVFKTATVGIGIVIAFTYIFRGVAAAFPTTVFILSWLINIVMFSGWRIIIREIKKPCQKVLIVGAGDEGNAVSNELKKIRHYDLLGFIDKDREKKDILGNYDDISRLIIEHEINEIIVTIPPTLDPNLWDIILQLEEQVKIKTVPDIYESIIGRIDSIEIEAIPLIELVTDPIAGWSKILKRLADIVISAVLLILFLPVMLIIVILIKYKSKGSCFFSQERIGKGGKIYRLYKFRSMVINAEEITGPVFAQKDDGRITSVGKMLRKFRLDEIPQLVNVLLGEMSLVGPRPERPFFVEQFKSNIPGYTKRFKVRPGITGLAQVNAGYDVSIANKLKYDLLYIRNYSFILDLKIICKTFLVMLGRRGAQ